MHTFLLLRILLYCPFRRFSYVNSEIWLFYQEQQPNNEFLHSAQFLPITPHLLLELSNNNLKVLLDNIKEKEYESIIFHYIGNGMNMDALPGARISTTHSISFLKVYQKEVFKNPIKLILDCGNTGNQNEQINSVCAVKNYCFDVLFEDNRDIAICSAAKGKSSYYAINDKTLFTHAFSKEIFNSTNVEELLLNIEHTLSHYYAIYHILAGLNKIIYAIDLKTNEEIQYISIKNNISFIPKITLQEMKSADLEKKIVKLESDIENCKLN